MPSGYTDPVKNGTITELPDFVWRCARAFGALIEMRDEPTGAKIPEFIEPSMSSYQRFFRAEVELAATRAMTMEMVYRAYKEERDEHYALDEKMEAEREEAFERYLDMLLKVLDWQPPTPEHHGLKELMIQQLADSISFDCRPFHFPFPDTPEEWHAQRIQDLEKTISRAWEAHQEELDRCRGRNRWVRDLRSSLQPVA